MRIDITVDTDDHKIIAHFQDYNSYAILCNKFNQSVFKLTIPELVNELQKISNGDNNEAKTKATK